MPMYTISTLKPFSKTTMEQLANLVTKTHCDLTGAPKTFVNVVFSHNVPLAKNIKIDVFANVRKGRTSETNKALKEGLIEALSLHMEIHNNEIKVSLFEVLASWVMEGGQVLPEPGEEADCEWLKSEESCP